MQHDDYDPHAFQELLPVLTAHQARVMNRSIPIQVVALEMHVDHNHHVAYMLWQKQFVTMISFEMFAKIFDLMPVSTLEK
jgi:hypothetical protein